MTHRIDLQEIPFLAFLMAAWTQMPAGASLDIRTRDPSFPRDFPLWAARTLDVEVMIKGIDRERHLYSALIRKKTPQELAEATDPDSS